MTRVSANSGMILADLRKMAGMTQLQVADRMGVGQPRVSQIEAAFPDLHFSVVQSYLAAVGGRIEFVAVGGESFPESALSRDTQRVEAAARHAQRSRSLNAA